MDAVFDAVFRMQHTLAGPLVCSVLQASGGSAGSSSGSTSSAGGSGGDAASPSGRGGEAGSEQSEAGGGEQPFLLPLMTLSKVKLPTESVPLQIFEPRYRCG